VGPRWSIDETYIRIAGRWSYAFRAIDEDGQVIDVYVSPTRDTGSGHRVLDTGRREHCGHALCGDD
jgi:transposase-like protein